MGGGKKAGAAAGGGEALVAGAKASGITRGVIERAGHQYHGRVKAVADGAREGGLEF